ncbi:MAG TPA: bifunctional nuclease family protein [Nitrospiria bacterium]|jgi:bifunctional DNase/RNase|nr:bifunctional nuclease family protein [Nitrospiria bacterium]
MEVKLSVHGILSDSASEAQIIILRDEKAVEILPIWVGVAEGNAIRFAIEGIMSARPLTHDLLRNLIEHLRVEVLKVVITEIRNNTYYATIFMKHDGASLTIDARPSDAIALALRSKCPIYAAPEVLKRKSQENLDAWLERLKPKDFGKYDA